MSRCGIAAKIGVSASTVSREIAKNSAFGTYKSVGAHEISLHRRSVASKIPKKMKGELEALVLKGLVDDCGIRIKFPVA
jgi:IS30 family transposase